MTKLFEDDLEDEIEVETIIPDDEPLKPFMEKYHDQKGVAKAIVEKDTFINKLKRENAELRAENLTRSKVEETVDRLLSSRATPSSEPAVTDPANPTNEGKPTGLTEEQVLKMIEATEAQKKSAENVNLTKKLMVEAFGAGWQNILVQRAKDLGESKEFFDVLAQRNPQAVLKLVGAPEVQGEKKQPSLFNGGLNTTSDMLKGGNAGTLRNQAYYDNLRKTMKVNFLPSNLQAQMHKDAIAQGPAFFT